VHGVDTAHTYVLTKTKAIANCDLGGMESDGDAAISASWQHSKKFMCAFEEKVAAASPSVYGVWKQ
jgi:hypothetical protein